jgi:hypothetical protein
MLSLIADLPICRGDESFAPKGAHRYYPDKTHGLACGFALLRSRFAQPWLGSFSAPRLENRKSQDFRRLPMFEILSQLRLLSVSWASFRIFVTPFARFEKMPPSLSLRFSRWLLAPVRTRRCSASSMACCCVRCLYQIPAAL